MNHSNSSIDPAAAKKALGKIIRSSSTRNCRPYLSPHYAAFDAAGFLLTDFLQLPEYLSFMKPSERYLFLCFLYAAWDDLTAPTAPTDL